MATTSIFDTLMELPLFQGVSRKIISEIIEKVPFHFVKYNDGEVIINTGETCDKLCFIMSGKVYIEIPCANKRVRMIETLSAPNVLGYSHLYGQTTKYPYKVSANGVCGVMFLSKSDYFNILQMDKIFLLNIMNALSRTSQQSKMAMLSLSRGTIQNRLAQLLLSCTHPGAKDMRLIFRQKVLCTLLGVQRTSLVNALEGIKEIGAIDYSLSEIKVIDMDKLKADLKV